MFHLLMDRRTEYCGRADQYAADCRLPWCIVHKKS